MIFTFLGLYICILPQLLKKWDSSSGPSTKDEGGVYLCGFSLKFLFFVSAQHIICRKLRYSQVLVTKITLNFLWKVKLRSLHSIFNKSY